MPLSHRPAPFLSLASVLVALAAAALLLAPGALRRLQEARAIREAADRPHGDAQMAAHVPWGAAFAQVVDARRAGRQAAASSIRQGLLVEGSQAEDSTQIVEIGGIAGIAVGDGAVAGGGSAPSGLAAVDGTERAYLPLLGRGALRQDLAQGPSLTPAPATALPRPSEVPPTATEGAPPPSATPSPQPAPALSYWRDAMPVLQRECATCHYSGGIAPFALETYAQAEEQADLIRWAVAERVMPPLPADPAAGKPFDDPRIMSQADRETLIRWVDGGAAEGDRTKAPTMATPERQPLGPPSLTVDIGADYRPPAGVSDDYRCFVIDPGFKVDTEITMVDILPQSAPMFHHGILYLARPDDLDAVRRLDRAEAGPGWTCFGGPGFDSEEWTAAEAVGALTRPYPAGTAKRIQAGSVFVLQQHYNTANGRFTDRSQVQFWKAERLVGKEPRDYRLVNPLFRIPAGAKETRATAFLDVVSGQGGGGGFRFWPTAGPGWLWRVWGHMHTLGSGFRLDLIRKDGSRERLLEIPRWDFNWQGAYDLIDPVRLEAGDRVEMTCVWDNSPENQPLVGGVKQQPRDVTWGEGTLDEMCLGGVTLTD